MKKQKYLNLLCLTIIILLTIGLIHYKNSYEKYREKNEFFNEISCFLDTIIYKQYVQYEKDPFSIDIEDSLINRGNRLIKNFDFEEFKKFNNDYGSVKYLPKINSNTDFSIFIKLIQISYFQENINMTLPIFGYNSVGLRTTINQIKKNSKGEIPIFLDYSLLNEGKYFEPKLLSGKDTISLNDNGFFKYQYNAKNIDDQYINFKLLFPTLDKYKSIDVKLKINVIK